jgi:predicted  nucleic acid-binding Zn-ribbon protein
MIHREIRTLTREVAKLEQQLADLEREGQRIADVRSSLERRFSDYRMARHAP